MKARTFQLFGDLVHRVQTDQRVVALTFDDGPTPAETAETLTILREEGVRATFFLVGREIEKHPESAAAIVADGHQIGNHSYSHQRMVFMSPTRVAQELEATNAAIRRLGVPGDLVFRPPYGKKLVVLPWVLAQADMVSVTWDVEPESLPHVAGNTDAIVEHVATSVRNGSIVLLHVMEGQEPSRRAIRPIIGRLREQGFEFVTVDELMDHAKRGSTESQRPQHPQ